MNEQQQAPQPSVDSATRSGCARTTDTREPWVVHPSSDIDRAWIVPQSHTSRFIGASSDMTADRDEYAQQICVLVEDAHGRRNTLADARLLAATPDLLAALQRAIAWCEDYGDTRHKWYSQGRAAIARATGDAA